MAGVDDRGWRGDLLERPLVWKRHSPARQSLSGVSLLSDKNDSS
jgi:hypothetical protein